MYKNISYFGGVNSLRFFAALLVLLHHSATIGRKYGLFDLENVGLFRNGANAVNFFFVLSGFLITYLLQKGTVSNPKYQYQAILSSQDKADMASLFSVDCNRNDFSSACNINFGT